MSPGPTENAAEIAAGVAACRQNDWRQGHEILSRVAQLEDSNKPFPGYFYSYLGVAIARREGRKREGVELALYGVGLGPRDPENRLNLARAYLLIHNRRRAVKQIHVGLRINPGHQALRKLQTEIGCRRKSFIPFLSRDSFLNQWMGRLTHQMEERRRERDEIEADEEELERLAGK